MQILEHPRLVTEQEDVHLIRSFLISTKPNKALWRINKETGHEVVQGFIGRDFYAHPERIFKPIEEGTGGHVKGSSFTDEMKQISEHSLGKITKLYGPFYYNENNRDGDYWYEAGIKLNGSKTASILLENGSKTWTHFAVSPHVWPIEGDDDNMTNWQPMGLALVIEPAYGQEAVVKKYCSGSGKVCSKSLTAAITEVINSFNTRDDYLNIMSTQQLQSSTNATADGTVVRFSDNTTSNTPISGEFRQPVGQNLELKKDENITLTKEEYDTVQKQLKEQEDLRNEVSQLKQERNTNILTQVFGSIEDEPTRNQIFERYLDKDVNLVKSVYEDVKLHLLPKLVEAKLAESKNTKSEEKKEGSKTASVLKPEPKISNDESKTASIPSEPLASDFRNILGL
ncbi:MAG TPA: hypothetical protein VL854_13480 [Nitrososphaeraceae archaeon]|nr:hypothetical protein [Nitrososphaeraceae archaeon]